MTLNFIQWNEANFDLIRKYLESKSYPNLDRLLSYNCGETTSEHDYEKLEPWIQWVSVTTCKQADEHKIFRLGDIVNFSGVQIYEELENRGRTVGVIGAMNVENRLERPSFFIPDPWTSTNSDGSFLSEKLNSAIKQAVNDNAKNKITFRSLFWLLVTFITCVKFKNYKSYLRLFSEVRIKKWNKALLLDKLLVDVYVYNVTRKRPDLGVVFLNGLAHIQHHYYFNSKHYEGKNINPDWLLPKDIDPIGEALDVYDLLIGDLLEVSTEFLVATGLTQVAYDKQDFYYRLSEHAKFLSMLGITYDGVEPRMTRDFLIRFKNPKDANNCASILSEITIDGVDQLFKMIDNRGDSLFVTLTYDEEISRKSLIFNKDMPIADAHDHIVFVAIKNGMHHGKGFYCSNVDELNYDSFRNRHVCNIGLAIRDFFELPG